MSGTSTSCPMYIVVGWFGPEEWIEGEWETDGPDSTWIQRAFRSREEANARSEELWETRTSESPDAPDYAQRRMKFTVLELMLR